MRELKPKLCGLWIPLFVAFEFACNGVPSQNQLASEHHTINRVPDAGVAGIERVGNLPMADENCPYEFQFVSDNDGWFFCNGRLWQTGDGGKNWRRIYASEQVEGSSVSLQFINLETGWRSSVMGVQKTEDGGHSWTPISSPIDQTNGEIASVLFMKDGKHGWLTGALYYALTPGKPENEGLQHVYQNLGKAPRGAIFSTDDGGMNWHQQFVSPYLGSFIQSVYASPDQQIWAIDNIRLYHFQDTVWNLADFEKASCVKRRLLETVGLDRSQHDIYEITAIYFDSLGYGWLAFRNGYLARTIDAGRTWCDLVDLSKGHSNYSDCFISVHFSDPSNGWALSASGGLYQSSDGGVSWTGPDPHTKFRAMYFLSAKRGWVAGKEGLFRINM